jgi:hypothetical protein
MLDPLWIKGFRAGSVAGLSVVARRFLAWPGTTAETPDAAASTVATAPAAVVTVTRAVAGLTLTVPGGA